MSTDIHQVITDTILVALERGRTGHWTCPWHQAAGGFPFNARTGRQYRGINVLALWLAAAAQGYADQRWATYRQWAALGAQVRRGEKGTFIVFFKELPRSTDDDSSQPDRRFVAKASIVFNAAQVDRAGAPELPERSAFDPVESAESLILACGVPIEHAGERACYVPSRDLVRLPDRALFVSPDAYYSTAFHELTHATGHKTRLDRDLSGRFGDAAYAMEELVAEISSAFVMASLGLAPEPHPESIAYIGNWLKVLRADKRAIFIAASAASKAAEYLTHPPTRAAQPASPHRPQHDSLAAAA